MPASNLPTGTVTFLFTDIEGSTRLWQEAPEGMELALAGHDRILEQAITSSGGHLLKHTGDGAFAVFLRAEQALVATIDAQRRFTVEEFPGVGRFKVRMGIHTGEGQERQGDYFGPAPSRTARLMSVGHGGQVLVSAATREVLGDTEFEFVDLGAHRLRDLARPEHVYQLRADDLPVEFPPLVSVDANPNNLPVQLTSFVGRETEVQDVSQLLAETRLITLTGAGGTGKTRLSLQVAAELTGSFADGVWLVELASVTDPELIVGQVAEPFGVRAMKTGRPLVEILADHLAHQELLLLLDNCEHVVESSSSVSETLLTRCPSLRIIATSRELLGVPGEVVYRVPPLTLPNSEDPGVEESEAVRLFADRAGHVNSSFRLSSDNLRTVQALAQRLDGLPLAIELAASRANLLTPAQLLERLDRRFQMIISARRDRGRHSTLETAMDWSYDLLPPAEQSLFRQLAAFSGGWTLEAAEAVCRVPGGDPVNLLGRLVDQSLVDVSEVRGTHRFRFLEPVRHYALAKLQEADEADSSGQRHAEYFADLAEKSDRGLRGPGQDDWVGRIELEHDNLRAAISWSLAEQRGELALRLATGLTWFWWVRGYWNEALDWFRRVYEATPEADPVLRGRLVYKLGGLDFQRARTAEVLPIMEATLPVLQEHGTQLDVAWTLSRLADAAEEPERGVALATESLRLFASEGDGWGEAYSRGAIGWNMWAKDQSQGFAELKSSVDALVDLGDRWTAAWIAFNLGFYLAFVGRYGEGRSVIEDSLGLVAGTDDRWIIPHCKNRLGIIATMTGDYQQAKELLSEALPVHRQIGDVICTAGAQTYLGEVLMDEGRFADAQRCFEDVFEGARELQNRYVAANGLRRMGWMAVAQGDREHAVMLLAAVETFRIELGGVLSVHDGRRMAEALESLKAAIEPELFEELWAAGVEMTWDEAIELAIET